MILAGGQDWSSLHTVGAVSVYLSGNAIRCRHPVLAGEKKLLDYNDINNWIMDNLCLCILVLPVLSPSSLCFGSSSAVLTVHRESLNIILCQSRVIRGLCLPSARLLVVLICG